MIPVAWIVDMGWPKGGRDPVRSSFAYLATSGEAALRAARSHHPEHDAFGFERAPHLDAAPFAIREA